MDKVDWFIIGFIAGVVIGFVIAYMKGILL